MSVVFFALSFFLLFFFHATATTEIYTLSLHDALPISVAELCQLLGDALGQQHRQVSHGSRVGQGDRKSTRLNSSHVAISYAVFCLKKKRACSRTHWKQHRSCRQDT